MKKAQKSNIEKYYDRIDLVKHYRQLGLLGFIRQELIAFEEKRNITADKMIPAGVKKMLDIGSKNGDFLVEEKDKYKEAVGVDLSEKVIDVARKNIQKQGLSKKIKFKKADLEAGLPFSDGEFDLVTCLAVLEHLFDPEKAVVEMGRVLKKGGYMIIEVPNIAWLPRRLSLLFGSMPRTSWAPGWDGGHLCYFTFGSLGKLIEKSGFKIVKIGCSGIFARFRYLYPPLLSGNIMILARKK